MPGCPAPPSPRVVPVTHSHLTTWAGHLGVTPDTAGARDFYTVCSNCSPAVCESWLCPISPAGVPTPCPAIPQLQFSVTLPCCLGCTGLLCVGSGAIPDLCHTTQALLARVFPRPQTQWHHISESPPPPSLPACRMRFR